MLYGTHQPSGTCRGCVYFLFLSSHVITISPQVDFLFDDIISAPTADEYKLALESNVGYTTIRNVGRRVSQAARRMSAAVGSAIVSASQAIGGQRQGSITASTSRLNLVLDETTRVVPEKVLHAHALASRALGRSLLEAFAQRESGASETPHSVTTAKDSNSTPPFVDIARCPSHLSSTKGDDDSYNIESGMSRLSRRDQRVHGIITSAWSLSDGPTANSIAPHEDIKPSTPSDDDSTQSSDLLQLLNDVENEYQNMPQKDKAYFCEAWRCVDKYVWSSACDAIV